MAKPRRLTKTLRKLTCSGRVTCNRSAPTVVYTLSLHDALPISTVRRASTSRGPTTRRAAGCSPCRDRKSTRLNSSHLGISYAVFCLKKKTEPIGERNENRRGDEMRKGKGGNQRHDDDRTCTERL